MPVGFDDFKYLLVSTCKITKFVLAIQIKSRTAKVLAEALSHSYMYFWTTKTPDSRQRFNINLKSHLVHSERYQLPIKNNKPIQSWKFKNRKTDTNYRENDNKTPDRKKEM